MRTIIDLPDTQLDLLSTLATQEKISRAELIRRALADYLQHHTNVQGNDAFGLWQQRNEDGMAYQQRLREEWGE